MKHQKEPYGRRAPSRARLWAYAAVIAFGALVGWSASPRAADPKQLQKETVENLLKTMDRIAKDAETPPSGEEQDTAEKEQPAPKKAKAEKGSAPTEEAAKPKENAAPEETAAPEEAAAPVRPYTPSPEPEDADGGLPEYRQLPPRDEAGGSDKQVVVIEVHEVIDLGLSAHIQRVIEKNPDASALILDINTPGGRVDAATLIRDALIEAPKTMRTVAFIHPRAISAGAFIAFACDLIFIADGGSMGAATPITIGGGEAAPVEEKMVSYFRTEMATTARAKGRRGDIAEAMVDASVEIEGITPAGKLLTLDTAGALRYEIADAKANDLEEVLALLGMGGATPRQSDMNWAEKLARILTDPTFSSILMSLGMLGILIELYQPGFGLPGIVGALCLIIFFAGHMVVNLAGWEEGLLLLLGIVLLGVEIFVTPGFGVLGTAGVLAIVVSLVLAMTSLPIDVSFSTGDLTASLTRVMIALGIAVGLFFLAVALLPKTARKIRLVLSAAIEETSAGGVEGEAVQAVLASGADGVAESFLRPAGIARFGDRRIDVSSEGEFIEAGTPVVIVRTSGNRVTVRKKG